MHKYECRSSLAQADSGWARFQVEARLTESKIKYNDDIQDNIDYCIKDNIDNNIKTTTTADRIKNLPELNCVVTSSNLA